MNKAKKTIIFECWGTGHRMAYVGYLLNYVSQNAHLSNQVVFLLGSDLYNKLKANGYDLTNTVIHVLPEEFDSPSIKASQAIGSIVRTIAEFPTISDVILLNYDLFQYSFLLSSPLKAFNVKSIWFRPIVHIPVKNFKSKLKLSAKLVLLKATLYLNSNISKLFILNDHEGAGRLNKKLFGGNRQVFSFLADPVDEKRLPEETSGSVKQKYLLDSSAKNMLITGSIDAKKNIGNILTAICELPKDVSVRLIIAGQIRSSYQAEFDQIMTSFHQRQDLQERIKIMTVPRFLTQQEFDEYMLVTDIVLMAYKDFYSSSGILGHAAKYRKPVLGSSVGLINDLIQQYEIGVTADPNDVKSIKHGIEQILTKNIVQQNYQRFLSDFTEEKFCKSLLD
jgi:glycosyltransferase involved in cell wall biosynthesis